MNSESPKRRVMLSNPTNKNQSTIVEAGTLVTEVPFNADPSSEFVIEPISHEQAKPNAIAIDYVAFGGEDQTFTCCAVRADSVEPGTTVLLIGATVPKKQKLLTWRVGGPAEE